ncbi:CSLREA domain-containing protein [Candidatus Albibeggiatoa sp. nov. NOAA]|uniref:CSLREA domain-containing protein n=1 Tax=Candidatus Albibeggiatoa sp. nov. NOAA TaxID=3162724 RepID=UPI003302E7B8|nr:CSLREA domain-containing protein [Thiotrichaceae bacterium]
MRRTVFLMLLSVWAFNLQAATIRVTTTEDARIQDGKCSLREAVQAANQNKAVDSCRAGSRNYTDVIQLGAKEYLLSIDLLDITENVIVSGKGMSQTTVNGQNRTRLFFVRSGVDLQLQDLTLTQGRTTNFGGAITNAGGLVTLYHCLFKQNLATGSSSAGGAIFNYSGTVNVHYSQFVENTAERGYGGGAIFNYQGRLNIENSQFLDNQANTGFGGAGIYNSEGIANIMNSSFSGNQANFGGGLFNRDGVVNLANVTLSGNHATFGGALNTFKGATYLSHTTIVNNTANYGAGVDNDGQLFLAASIVLNNQSKVGAAGCNNGSNSQITTGGYNVFAIDNGCEKQATDLVLADAATQLDLTLKQNDAANGMPLTHALLENSVLIDAIPAQDCRYLSQVHGYNPLFSHRDRVLVDQRNAVRDYQQACDIGAYEFAAVPPSKTTDAPNLPTTHYLTVKIQGEGHVSSYPAGLNCGANQTCQVEFYTGTDLTLTAEATENTKLVAWEGDCATKTNTRRRLTRALIVPEPEPVDPPVNQTVRVNLNTHKQCTAVFAAN